MEAAPYYLRYNTGAKPREDHTDFPPLAHGADPVPNLPVRDLLQCNHCSFLTPSTKWLQQHHRSHYASDVPRPLALTPVQGQTWFDHARFCRYWVTAAAPRPTSPRPLLSLPTLDGITISTSPGSGRLSSDGPLLPTPPLSSPTPTSNDTDSASTGRSPETLPFVLLSRPALESREIQRPGMCPLSGHYTAILRIIGASFDRVMARALDTLDITHEPIRQIFHSTIAGTPYKRADTSCTGRFGPPPSPRSGGSQILGSRWIDAKRSSSSASRRRWTDFSASRTRWISRNKPHCQPRKRSLSVSSNLDNPGERPAAKRRTTRYQIAIAVCIPSRPRTPGRSRPIVAGRTVEPSPEPYAPPSTPTLARSPSAIDPRSPPHGPSARRFPRQSHFKANHRSAATPYQGDSEGDSKEDFLGSSSGETSSQSSDNEEDEAEEDLPPPIIELTLGTEIARRDPVRLLLAFTAVLGIQASTLTLKEPYSYSTSLSALIWSPDYQTLFYRGSPQGIHLDDLRRWIQALLQSVTRTLEHDLLLGILPSIDLTTLVDDLGERRAGFCFLDLPANLLQPTYAPLLAAQASPLPGIVPLRRRDRWDRRAVMAYRACAQRFLDRLALLIQLTWGQPSREPELLPLRWRNTAAAPRNLYLRESTYVARFLPPAVSRLVVLYLLRVRPFLELLHQQLRPDGQPRLSPSRVPPGPRDDELFALPGAKSRRARAGTITALMRQTAQPFLQGQDIPTHHYRHIAIAVAKKHLASQATPADWGTAAAAMGNILAAQAGHHSRINEQVYAVEAGQPFGLLPGRIEQFACQTALYHTQVRRYVEDHSRNPSLSDPERQTLQSLKIQSLPNIWHRLRAQAPPIPPFPSLPQWEAVTCQWPSCSALCISRKSMQTHIRSQHALPDPGTVRSLIGGPVPAQSLTRARGFIFRVQRAVDAEEPGYGGSRPRGDEGLAHPDSREVRAYALRYPGCGVFVARP
ncbi:telomere-associated recQ-like helicase [Aspergillus terreus]|uniref:Telomere-associated recQ-like helicase n=1 Tax=Aspergillus terreus TaxID=33178 RepID=A0A8H3REN0_ASPTE|nr:telomere-associated recQ-like helicase [Aspergillus terreus]